MRTLALVVVALVGGVTGTLLTRVAAGGAGRRQDSPEVSELRAQVEALSRQNGQAAARLATLEADGARGRATERAAPAAAAPAPTTEPPRRETAAEQREQHAELLARHAAEPVDGPWAHEASRDIGQALGTLGSAGGLKVASLDCRSQTCLVHLSWPTMKDAQDHRHSVLTVPTALPCERMLYLGAEGQHDEEFEGTLLLSCPRGR